LAAGVAHAVVFTGSSGNLAASANFENLGGGTLKITLTNTSLADVLVPADVLTAVFFNIGGNPTLTPVSAVLGAGSTVWFDAQGQPVGGNVGGEWAYAAGFSQFGANRGISSSGFGLFGGANFNGPDLDDPAAVNGLNYGLLSAGDNTTTGNSPVTGDIPLVKNSVVFTLTGLTGALTVTNVTFQYGTSLGGVPGGEPSIPGEPAPGVPDGGSTIILCGVAFSLLGLALRRFGRQVA
jgi:hypothetical protein